MAAEGRILRALLRIEADKQAARDSIREVERVEEAVDDLGQSAEGLNLGQRIQQSLGRVQGGVGQALGRLPGFDPSGQLTDQTVTRLEFLGDGFEQVIDTAEELGVELDNTARQALRAAGSLARIQTDPLGAAVNAIGQVIQAWQDFTGRIEEGEQKVQDAWSELLDGEFSNAADVAREYEAAQGRINEAHDKGGVLADASVSKTEILNASQFKLQRTLAQNATSYNEYRDAVNMLNDSVSEGEEAVSLLTEAEYERAKAARGLTAILSESVTGVAAEVVEAAADARETKLTMDKLGEAFGDMTEALEERENDLNDALEELAQEHQDALTSIDERGAARREALMQQFIDQSNAAEEAYYARRAQLAEQFGVAAARAEQDHQLRMRRMREDAQERESDLIASRDALGLVRARRDAEKERRRADEDFNIQEERRAEDYARQLEQMRVEFERQQAARQEQYQQQLDALDAQQQAERDALLEKKADQENILKQQYNDEQQIIRANFKERRQELGVFLAGERQVIQEHYEQLQADLDVFLAGARRGAGLARRNRRGGGRGRQAGGYVGAGLYEMGESGREFVLNNPTTRAAERMAGAPLTQSGVLGAMGGNSVSLSQHINIQDGRDPEAIARAVRRETVAVLDEVFSRVK